MPSKIQEKIISSIHEDWDVYMTQNWIKQEYLKYVKYLKYY